MMDKSVNQALRFGIWGCGMISGFHADAINQTEDAVLTAAFDVNEQSLRQFCEKYPVEGFRSEETFAAADNVDAICICLPSGLHYEAAKQCLTHKKHVLIEIPLTLTTEDADSLIAIAKENGVFVGVVSQLRYSEAAQQIKQIMDSGALGKVILGNAIMKYYRAPEYYSASPWRGTWKMDGGGALMNQGIHGVDLLQFFMGQPISVCASSKTLVHNIETEDTVTAVIEFENGAIGTIQATTSVYPGYPRRIEICGSKGSVVLQEDTIEVCDVPGWEELILSGSQSDRYASSSRPDAMSCHLHAKQIADFVRSVRNGMSPWLDANEGRKAIAVICAIYESAQTGRKVYL